MFKGGIRMNLITNRAKGTQDVLPKDSFKRSFVEKLLFDIAKTYGFGQIRTPVFEYTELFNKSVGDTTDVVQKEMYTFKDKGDRSITLRPEGTTPVVRAMLENGLHNNALPIKLSYLMSCYRYENPQAGRYREFNQFGAEIFGSEDPAADAELIFMANDMFNRLGIKGLTLEINSIGCPKCKEKYYLKLQEYLESKKADLCPICVDRLSRTPLRVLDCKSPICAGITKDAPVILDFLCEECSDHFEKVKSYLSQMQVLFKINPRIVRGLDYYTKTVFEFISTEIGAQGALGGGGRYDGLVKMIGGVDMPAVGVGLGFERIMLILEKQQIPLLEPEKCTIYIAGLGYKAREMALKLACIARQYSINAQCDIVGRGLKAQMKFADKIEAAFSIVIGEDELKTQTAKLKNMKTGETREISLDVEHFGDEMMGIDLENRFGKVANNK